MHYEIQNKTLIIKNTSLIDTIFEGNLINLEMLGEVLNISSNEVVASEIIGLSHLVLIDCDLTYVPAKLLLKHRDDVSDTGSLKLLKIDNCLVSSRTKEELEDYNGCCGITTDFEATNLKVSEPKVLKKEVDDIGLIFSYGKILASEFVDKVDNVTDDNILFGLNRSEDLLLDLSKEDFITWIEKIQEIKTDTYKTSAKFYKQDDMLKILVRVSFNNGDVSEHLIELVENKNSDLFSVFIKTFDCVSVESINTKTDASVEVSNLDSQKFILNTNETKIFFDISSSRLRNAFDKYMNIGKSDVYPNISIYVDKYNPAIKDILPTNLSNRNIAVSLTLLNHIEFKGKDLSNSSIVNPNNNMGVLVSFEDSILDNFQLTGAEETVVKKCSVKGSALETMSLELQDITFDFNSVNVFDNFTLKNVAAVNHDELTSNGARELVY